MTLTEAMLADGQMWAWLIWLGGGTLALAVVLRLWLFSHRQRPRPSLRRLLRDENGTATLEFTLVFPLVLFFALAMTQVMLMMVGNYFVHYAAYAATRSAITMIPIDFEAGGEQRNFINADPSGGKLREIHQSAAVALVPVSGRATGGNVPTGDFVSGLNSYFSQYTGDPPNWVDRLAAERLRYAAVYTDVALYESDIVGDEVVFYPIAGSHEFGPHDAVSVEVTHKLNLSVPFVRVIWADGRHALSTGEGAYAEVIARATLTNQGIDDQLPEPPELPREP